MTGYTRQSSANIINGADITAPPLNAEFNKLRDAFDASSGHSHDGSTGNSPKIDLTTSVSGTLPAIHGGSGGKNNFSATSTPVATDDSTQGYAVGSFWYNTQTQKLYVLTNSTASSAVWAELSLASSTGVLTNVDIDSGTIDGTSIGASTPSTGSFTSLAASGTSTLATVDINGGAIDGTTIGATTTASGAFTTINASALATLPVVDIDNGNIDNTVIGANTPELITGTTITANTGFSGNLTGNVTGNLTGNVTGDVTGDISSSGTSTFATVDINGGNIDGTIIGANTTAAGSFTTVSTSGQATLTSVDINGGLIDGVVIGGSTANAVTGTTITANTGFVGGLTGDVTGNITGNVTGNTTGNLTGNVSGNVTASTGTTTLNNLVVNGTADFTSTQLDNLLDPTSDQQAATKKYVDDEISTLVGGAGAALDTLGEIATALGNDAALNTTLTNSIATKLPLAGGTMSGDIVLGSSKATSTATPATADTLTRKGYVDTQDATKLNLSGGTMSGAIAMGTNKITGLGTPTNTADATTKSYVDGILGSATSASTSASQAATSASQAATSASNASTSETNAASSATSAANTLATFQQQYHGPLASAPTSNVNAGDLWFNTTSSVLSIYDGSNWQSTAEAAQRALTSHTVTSSEQSAGTVTVSANYTVGLIDVYLNGLHLGTSDFTATNGTSVTIANPTAGDIIDIIALSSFNAANYGTLASKNNISESDLNIAGSPTDGYYLKADNTAAGGLVWDQVDLSTKLSLSGGTMTGALDMGNNNITTTGKVLFANMYSQTSDLPSATTYHGMFAHVHGTGKAYYAHANAWVELANNSQLANYLTTSAAASTYAPLNSPALTGNPTAPTQTAGNNTTRLATTEFVSTAVANLVDSAPGTLNTLNELAAALNDDPSFATTITTSIGTKLNASAVSTFGGTLIDDADAATARTTLGLGAASTIAIDNNNFVKNDDSQHYSGQKVMTLYNDVGYITVPMDISSVLGDVLVLNMGSSSNSDERFIQFNSSHSPSGTKGNIHYNTNDYLTVESNSYLTLQSNVSSTLRSVILGNTFFKPFNADTGQLDLGTSSAKWKELHLSGVAYASGFSGKIHPVNGATTNYLSLKDSNELNFFNSSNSSIKLYINYDGGDVALAGNAITATHNGNTTFGGNIYSSALISNANNSYYVYPASTSNLYNVNAQNYLYLGDKLYINSGGGSSSVGTAGQVLTSGGTGNPVSWQDAGGGAYEVIGNYTGTGVSSLDFVHNSNNFVFDSTTYKHMWMYAMIWNNNVVYQNLYITPLVGSTSSYAPMTNLVYFHEHRKEMYPEFTGVNYGAYQWGQNAQYGANNQGKIASNIVLERTVSSGDGMAMFSESIGGTTYNSNNRFYPTQVRLDFQTKGCSTDFGLNGQCDVWYDNPSIYAYKRYYTWQMLNRSYGKVGFRITTATSGATWNYDITWIGLKP